jgi:hypothetical protein
MYLPRIRKCEEIIQSTEKDSFEHDSLSKLNVSENPFPAPSRGRGPFSNFEENWKLRG